MAGSGMDHFVRRVSAAVYPMSLIRTSVAGEAVRLFVLPPETQHFVNRWHEFIIRGREQWNSIYGLDVETSAIDEDMGSFDPAMKLRMVQFGLPDEAWCFDADSEFWHERIYEFLQGWARFCSHTNYDPLWIHRAYGVNLNDGDRSLDTYPIACQLYPGRIPKDLKSLSSLHIDGGLRAAEESLTERFKQLAPVGQRTPKKLKAWGFTNIPLTDKVFGRYAGLDAIYVRRLLPILQAKVKAQSPASFRLAKREQKIQRIATDVQIRGQRLDKPYTEKLIADIGGVYETADIQLRETFGFTPRSPRVGPWLEERGVQFNRTMRTPTGRPKLDADTVEILARLYGDHDKIGPVLAGLRTLAENKNILTNLQSVYNAADKNGFVHPKINTQAAITGRMSIVKPAMQTFKKRDKRLRGCFIARDGCVFVGADYDGQENRLAAAFSNDPALREIVQSGESMHKKTARMLFGDDFSEGQYDIAKVLDFAQQYGAGPVTIARQLGTTPDKARGLWNAWRKAYGGLVRWSDYVAGFDTVVNPWGREIPTDPRRRYANGNYCFSPETLVLRSDLRHVPANVIKVGDRVVAFDEDATGTGALNRWGSEYKIRRMRTAVVEAVGRVWKPSVSVKTSDGRSIICSKDHMWLTHNAHREIRTKWVTAENLSKHDKLLSLGTWKEDTSRKSGYLAGLYDGEGCLSSRGEGHHQSGLTFSQKKGLVMDAFVRMMKDLQLPFSYRIRPPNSTSPCDFTQTTGIRNIMRVLGTLQPKRFQPRFEQMYEGVALVGGLAEIVSVESVDEVGYQELVFIQTSTHTLVAEGFLSHNSIQSSGRDVLGDAFIKLDSCGLSKYIWLPIHDEIVLEVPEKIAERARGALERKMFHDMGNGIQLTASATIMGTRWNGEN